MVDYVRLASVANRLVQENGRPISFIRLNEVPADSSNPWDGPGPGGETSLSVYGVFVPPNTVRQFGLSALGEGTEFEDLVTFSEQIIITSQGEIDLRQYTKVEDGGIRWGIVGLQVLRPGLVTMLAFVGVRR